ncbi:MAG TPA: YicC/YloC family endoribonuclease [Gemmatimonadales bacterium]|nr:YicC/YloC family endoribonuclease [Gemmatimonadales bacterium]
MTGFGTAEGAVSGGRLRVEIKTVNHRHFNPSFKLPSELSAVEGDLREALRKEFDRGHVSLSVRWTEWTQKSATLKVDLDRAREVSDRLRELRDELGLTGQVSLELVARQSGVLTDSLAEEGAAPITWAEFEPTVSKAVTDCQAMRAREGAALAAELEHRFALMEKAVAEIERLAPERIVRERDRLRAAVTDLLDGRTVDEQRLAQELAFLAEKLDITEELVRFRTHLAACRQALPAKVPVGKQLGFLAQELGREVNTMGSKANDAGIVTQVVAMKGELEKVREQVENLE